MTIRLRPIAEGTSYPIRLRFNDPLSTTPAVLVSGTWRLYGPDGEPITAAANLPGLSNPIIFAVPGSQLVLADEAPAEYRVLLHIVYNASYGNGLDWRDELVFTVTPLVGVSP